ncbi:MAG: hypothetical protein J6K91_04370 [Opitutales bacterium]|nr:hypothetical protein [Opitutales bacterium]
MKKTLAIILMLMPLLANAISVKIDTQKRYQKMEYFTASDAWSTQYIGDYWADKFKEKIAQLLFSQKFDEYGNPEGIGLSLWRVNLGGGTLEGDESQIDLPYRAARSYLAPSSTSYDWSHCKGLEYFMQKAREYGCNQFLLFSNSPLVQWTKNGKGYSSNMNTNIAPENIGKFADYLADCTKHFLENGYDIKYVSPINEPQMTWTRSTQEGSPWANSDIKKMFVELDRALSERKLDSVKMLAGECIRLETTFSDLSKRLTKIWETSGLDKSEFPSNFLEKFFSPKSKFYIGDLKHLAKQISAHSYHSHIKNKEMKSIREQMKIEAEKYGVDFHQTEWCHLGSYSNYRKLDGFTHKYNPDSMNDMQTALNMAKLIYADIVFANSKSWGYWVATEIKFGLCALIHTAPHSDSVKKGGTIVPTKLLWALGNYSFFIRPNYQRVSLEGADSLDSVMASAYLSPDENKLVVVCVNMNESLQSLNFSLPTQFANAKINAYTTDERRDLAKFVEEQKSDKIRLLPRSITTIVFEK